MGDLSPHFSRSEFVDRETGKLIGPDPELVAVLERLRAIDGKPLPIVSGYRYPTARRLATGARKSQHFLGRAADIPSGRFTVAQARAAGARGIGYWGQWATHVDVRRTRRVVTWPYK